MRWNHGQRKRSLPPLQAALEVPDNRQPAALKDGLPQAPVVLVPTGLIPSRQLLPPMIPRGPHYYGMVQEPPQINSCGGLPSHLPEGTNEDMNDIVRVDGIRVCVCRNSYCRQTHTC